jgi:hypothetical protein
MIFTGAVSFRLDAVVVVAPPDAPVVVAPPVVAVVAAVVAAVLPLVAAVVAALVVSSSSSPHAVATMANAAHGMMNLRQDLMVPLPRERTGPCACAPRASEPY